MTDTRTYHEQTKIDQTIRLREVLKTLPSFARDYFRAIEPRSSARTRINYAYDIRVFFHFLMENKHKKILFLELGVGRMTPMFIQQPFWNMTYSMPQAYYITINPKDALLPDELEGKG